MSYRTNTSTDKIYKPLKNRLAAFFSALLVLSMSSADMTAAASNAINANEGNSSNDIYVQTAEEAPSVSGESSGTGENADTKQQPAEEKGVLDEADVEALSADSFAFSYSDSPTPFSMETIVFASSGSGIDSPTEEEADLRARQKLAQFSVNYVTVEENESDDDKFILRDDDFSMKYGMKISTDYATKRGAIEISLDPVAFTDRYGNDIILTDIGVHEANFYYQNGKFYLNGTAYDSYEAMEEDRGVDAVWNKNSSSSTTDTANMNYYKVLAADGSVEKYILVNYQDESSANWSITFVYNNIDVFNVVNGTGWTFEPDITVDFEFPIERTIETSDGNAFTGKKYSDGTDSYYMDINTTGGTSTETYYKYNESSGKFEPHYTKTITKSGNSETIAWTDASGNPLTGDDEPVLTEVTRRGTVTSDDESVTDDSYTFPVKMAISKDEIADSDSDPSVEAFIGTKYLDTETDKVYYLKGEATGTYYTYNTATGKYEPVTSPPTTLTQVKAPYDNVITGLINSNARINDDGYTQAPGAKKEAIESERSYGSNLYTVNQMSQYMTRNLTNDKAALQAAGYIKDGKLNDDYVYTGWYVTTNGVCTQPWKMYFNEHPGYNVWVEAENGVAKVYASSASDEGVTEINGEYYKQVYVTTVSGYSDSEGHDAASYVVLGKYEDGTVTPDLSETSTEKHTQKIYIKDGDNYVERYCILFEGNAAKVGKADDENSPISNIVSIVTVKGDNGRIAADQSLEETIPYSDAAGANVLTSENAWLVADTTTSAARSTYGLTRVNADGTFSVHDYVIVAYKKSDLLAAGALYYTVDDDGRIIEQYDFTNSVDAVVLPVDDSAVSSSAAADAANSTYNSYIFNAGDQGVFTNKRATSSSSDGFITVYDTLTEDQDSLGELKYYARANVASFNSTHEGDGTYKEGTYVHFIAADDVLTAEPRGTLANGKRVKSTPVVLGYQDYFYNSVKITVTEEGRDTEEDRYAAPTDSAFSLPESADHDWTVYIWKDDATGWEKYGTISYDDYWNAVKNADKATGYSVTYTFDKSTGPCRVKVEHDTVDFNSKVEFDISVSIKKDSPKFNRTDGTLRPEKYDWFEVDDPSATHNADEIAYYNFDLRNYIGATGTAMKDENGTPTVVKQMMDHEQRLGSNYAASHHNEYALTKAYNGEYGDVDDFDPATDNKYVTPNYLFSGTGTSLVGFDYSNTDNDTFEQKNITRTGASQYISALQKESEAKKYAYTTNDKINNLVNITYTLTGREGYTFDTARFSAGSTIAEQLQDEGYGYLEDREYVYFYDLLPPGVIYSYDASNPPKVGKLSTLTIDSNDDGQRSVDELNAYVNSMDSHYWQIIGEPETFRDWKKSGRMLVRFKVGLKDGLSDDEKREAKKLIYGSTTEKKWYLGLGVQFTAYVPWDRYASAQTQDNIFVYVTDKETCGIHAGGTTSGSPVYDDWTAGSGYVPKNIGGSTFNSSGHPVKNNKLEYDLFDGVTDMLNRTLYELSNPTLTDPGKSLYNRMFASTNSLGLIADSSANGIRKQVRAESDKYASFDSKTSVIAGEDYDYRITISESGSGVLGNIMIYDYLDGLKEPEKGINWQGKFDSLQFQEIINMYEQRLQTVNKTAGEITGVTPCTAPDYGIEVYYTMDAGAAAPTYSSETGSWTTTGWKKADSLSAMNTETGENTGKIRPVSSEGEIDRSEIKGIAVKLPDGFYLGNGETLSITIRMTSPPYDSNLKYAKNEATYCFTEGSKFPVGNKFVFKENSDGGTYLPKTSMPTLVTLGQLRKMYVKKEIEHSDALDESIKNSDFTFNVKQQLAIVSNSGDINSYVYDYSYREYYLYDLSGVTSDSNIVTDSYIIDNGKKYVKRNDNIYMTNENGQFELQDGQLAYFEFIAGVTLAEEEKDEQYDYPFDNVIVYEEASDTWYTDQQPAVSTDIDNGKLEDIVFKNYYEPRVSISKKTSAVPDSVTPPPEGFEFKMALFEYDYYTATDEAANPSHKAGTVKSVKWVPYEKIKNSLSDDGDYKCVDIGNAVKTHSELYPITFSNEQVKLSESGEKINAACLSFKTKIDETKNQTIYIEKREGNETVGMLKRVLMKADDDSTPDADESEYESFPRYGYVLFEDLEDYAHWQLRSMEHDGTTDTNGTGSSTKPYIHPIEFNSDTLTFTNTYDLKDILLTKNVTTAPDDIEDYAFVFRLKRNNANITSEEANAIKWELCDYVNKRAVSQSTPVKGSMTFVKETEDDKYNYCTFVVPMCGNDKNSGAVKTIRISGVPVSDNTYTIEEVLDGSVTESKDITIDETPYTVSVNAENNTVTVNEKDYKLARNTMFYNSIMAGSKKLTLDSSTVSMKIENDYLMRSLIVQKTVAGVSDDTDFTLYLVRSDGQKSDFIEESTTKYVYGDSSKFMTDPAAFLTEGTSEPVEVVTLKYSAEANGAVTNEVQAIRLTLKAGDTAVFKDIDLKGTGYSLYEQVDPNFPPLFDGNEGRIYAAEDGSDIGKIELAGPAALRMKQLSDSPNEILNGDSDYVMIGKLYTGITDKGYQKPVTLQLELGGEGYDRVPVTLMSDQNTDNGKPIISISNAPNVACDVTGGFIKDLNYLYKVVVNLKALYKKMKDDGARLPEYEDLQFYVTETEINDTEITNDTNYITLKESEKYIVIRSEDTNREISGNINSHNVNLMNNISEYGGEETDNSVIYKRIACSSTTESGTGLNLPDTPLKFRIVNGAGEPISGVSYVAAFNGTQYMADSSDADGIITVPISNEATTDWEKDGVKYYLLELHFSNKQTVTIDESTCMIKEIPDAKWGTLIGYEAYADSAENKICNEVIENGTQWDIRENTLDTFVNTLETTEVEVYKSIQDKPAAPDPNDAEKYPLGEDDPAYKIDLSEYNECLAAEFTYDVKQLIDGNAVSATPEIMYSVYVRNSDGSTGAPVTDKQEIYTVNGQFKLKDGQMAVLNMPRYTEWQITEVQHGTYKLVSDESGDIMNDEAFTSDEAAAEKGAQIIGTGFKIGTDTKDLYEPEIIDGVVLINGHAKGLDDKSAKEVQIMFAMYDNSQDSDNRSEQNKIVHRTHKLKSTQTEKGSTKTSEENYYYTGDCPNSNAYIKRYGFFNKDNEWSNNDYLLGVANPDLTYTYSNVIVINDNNGTYIWSRAKGVNSKDSESSPYRPNSSAKTKTITLPDEVYWTTENDPTVVTKKIVGIGRLAYAGEDKFKEIVIPKYVKKIGDGAFYNASSLAKVTFICDDLQVIGEKAFAKTKINNITIPSTVECIEKGAFSDLQKVSNKRSLKLIIFETDNASKLYLPASIGLETGNDAPYVVFTNLTRDQANAAGLIGGNIGGDTSKYVFKGEMTETLKNTIISNAGEANLSQATKDLLNAAVATNSPTSQTTSNGAKPISYLEKKRKYSESA